MEEDALLLWERCFMVLLGGRQEQSNAWDACIRLSNKMQLLSFVVQLLLKVCLTSKRQFSLFTGKSTDAYGRV